MSNLNYGDAAIISPEEFCHLARPMAAALWGPRSTRMKREAIGNRKSTLDNRADRPSEWPEDKTRLQYLHRGLLRRLLETDITDAAIRSIRRELEDGHLCTVVIDDKNGKEFPLEPMLWTARETSAEMYWSGRFESAIQGVFVRGDIYIKTPSQAADTPELELSKSDALCKLLLHLVGRKTPGQIAAQMVGTEFAVSERHVSRLIREAREILAEKRL